MNPIVEILKAEHDERLAKAGERLASQVALVCEQVPANECLSHLRAALVQYRAAVRLADDIRDLDRGGEDENAQGPGEISAMQRPR